MNPNFCSSSCGQIFAALILRLWVGFRLLLAGADKWRYGTGTASNFSQDAYHENTQRFMSAMADNSFLSAYVVPRDLMLKSGDFLGYALLGVGALIIVGLFRSLSLLVGGLILLGLSIGLGTLPDDDAMVMVGLQLAVCAFALTLAKHDWISVDGVFRGLFRKARSGSKESSED